jgi:Colicin V production protein
VVSFYSMLWICAVFFAVIGVIRGLRREIVSLGGIILATFALYQFDSILRGVLLASVSRNEAAFVQIGLFLVVVYFAYQTRSFGSIEDGRDGPRSARLQDAVMGGLLGALNGYLMWGAIWYFLDINDYPFSSLISAPAPGSISAQSLNAIPLVLIGGATGGSGQFLTILVILLFLAVLFVM